MTALPSIHALRAIHEPTAQFIIKTGRFEKSNRPLYFFAWVWYNQVEYIILPRWTMGKNKKLDVNTVRVIKISKEALFEFIYESFIADQKLFFDVKKANLIDKFYLLF